MASRKPVVFINGQFQNLPAGDTISTPATGGTIISQTNDEAGAIAIGTIVYNDANDGVKKAKADAAGTKNVIGLVYDTSISNGVAGFIQIDGVFQFASTAQVDAIFGTSGGFVVGVRYFLSTATAGLGTATVPSTTGQYVVEIGLAVSTTEIRLNDPFTPFLL